jgi:signal transduction histidine kinase
MKTARQLSIFLLSITSFIAYFVSYHMITDPTGNSLGLPFYLLSGSGISSFSFSGWILLFIVAIFSTFIIICIYLKVRFYSFLIMVQGVFICLFTIVQMILLGETFVIQYATLITGGALIGLGALLSQWKIVTDSEKNMQATHPTQKSHHHKHRKRGS